MNIQFKFRNAAVVLLLIAFGAGCKKSNDVIIPPTAAHFMNQTFGIYFITGPGVVYNLPIGVTTVSDKDRTVNISVSSPTGAVQGTHYTIDPVVIHAGKAIDSMTIHGAYNLYTSGRKDTLIIVIENGKDGIGGAFNDTFRLALRGACFEGNVDLNLLLGDYNNTNETFGTQPYGPYTTSIISVNPINATSGEITVSNIFDFGWNPITFLLDWSDPDHRTVTLVEQSGIGDAGTLDPSLGGLDISVRPYGGQVGTFSACNEKFTLVMQVGVTGLGWSSDLYTVSMAR